jgi:hypothetical protein
VDTSKVEFAFLCVDKEGAEVKHTFGVGGFLDEEEYDTEVGCDKCILEDGVATSTKKAKVETVEPVTDTVAPKEEPAAKAEVEPAKAEEPAKVEEPAATTAAPAKAEATKGAPATADDTRTVLTKFANSKKKAKKSGAGSGVPPATAKFYGPGGCVATFKSDSGTCVMQTRCEGQNISDYDFGLDCLDGEGETTRHLFGKNSFDPEETFDTLVPCQTCMGVDQQAPKEVGQLATNVLTLQHEMSSIKDDLKVIKEHLQKEKADKDEKEAKEKEEKEKDIQEAPEDEASDEAADEPAESEDAEAADEPPAEDAEADAEATTDAEDAAASLAATESAEDEAPAPKRTFLRTARKHRAHTANTATVRLVTHTRDKHKHAKHHRSRPAEDLDLEAPEVDDY